MTYIKPKSYYTRNNTKAEFPPAGYDIASNLLCAILNGYLFNGIRQ